MKFWYTLQPTVKPAATVLAIDRASSSLEWKTDGIFFSIVLIFVLATLMSTFSDAVISAIAIIRFIPTTRKKHKIVDFIVGNCSCQVALQSKTDEKFKLPSNLYRKYSLIVAKLHFSTEYLL